MRPHDWDWLRPLGAPTTKVLSVLLFLLQCKPAPAAVTASKNSPLPIGDVIRTRTPVGPMQFSQNGHLVYVVQTRPAEKVVDDANNIRTGVPQWAIGCDIFVVDPKSGETRNVTQGAGNNWLPAWSPDGRHLAFLSDRDGDGQAHLWLWDAGNGRSRMVSNVRLRTEGMGQIQWTEDGKRILVATVPEGVSLEDYVQHVRQKKILRKSAGDRTPNSTATVYESVVDSSSKDLGGSDIFNFLWTWRDLALVSIRDGSYKTILHGKNVSRASLSNNGLFVAYASPQRFEKAGSQQILYDLGAVTLSTRTDRVLVSGIRFDLAGLFNVSPDSSQIAFCSGGELDEAHDLYVVSVAKGGMPQNLTNRVHKESDGGGPAQGFGLSLPLWSADGKRIYSLRRGTLWRTEVAQGVTKKVGHLGQRAIVKLVSRRENTLWTDSHGNYTIVITHDDTGDAFYQVDLETGAQSRLLERQECYTCSRTFEGGYVATAVDGLSLAYFAEDAQHAPQIWKTSPDFAGPRRLTDLNPEFDKHEMGAARLVEWLDDDGQRLRGALVLPSEYEQGKRYPLVVLVYGGRFLSDSVARFGGFESGLRYLNVQLLATRGYAVLMPDAPQHLGTPMLDLGRTILPGVSKVVEMGIADDSRVGVMGHSYGGYSTMSLLVQTKRFKAAVESGGFSDLISDYGQMRSDGTAYGMLLETGQGLMGGTPWQYGERYIENSPFFYFDRIATPLLMIHGAEDPFVQPFLADQVFVGLRRLGKEVEYAKYGGEAHWLTSYENQVDACSRMISWFDRFLKTSERAANADAEMVH